MAGQMTGPAPRRAQPQSPNMQIYRPQLTSVLSIVNRVTGVLLSLYAVALVAWLVGAAAGPDAYSTVHAIIVSWPGQILLFICTLSLFVHLCGGIRHLIWDAYYGFELGTIYASGWAVVIASILLTIVAWIAGLVIAG
jgi:succinate dehydrogenase / fumarate reductase cytochrome b subunit